MGLVIQKSDFKTPGEGTGKLVGDLGYKMTLVPGKIKLPFLEKCMFNS